MTSFFDQHAAKKATNLTVNSDLLLKAKAHKINLSATLEQALEKKLRAQERKNWRKNNKQAITALNEFADRNGLFSDRYRKF